MSFAAYYIFKLLSSRKSGKTRMFFAAFAAGYLSLVLASIITAFEFGIQPMIASTADGKALYCPYDLSIAIPAMAIEHLLLFGIIEGMVTALVISYFSRKDMGFIYAFKKHAKNEIE